MCVRACVHEWIARTLSDGKYCVKWCDRSPFYLPWNWKVLTESHVTFYMSIRKSHLSLRGLCSKLLSSLSLREYSLFTALPCATYLSIKLSVPLAPRLGFSTVTITGSYTGAVEIMLGKGGGGGPERSRAVEPSQANLSTEPCRNTVLSYPTGLPVVS